MVVLSLDSNSVLAGSLDVVETRFGHDAANAGLRAAGHADDTQCAVEGEVVHVAHDVGLVARYAAHNVDAEFLAIRNHAVLHYDVQGEKQLDPVSAYCGQTVQGYVAEYPCMPNQSALEDYTAAGGDTGACNHRATAATGVAALCLIGLACRICPQDSVLEPFRLDSETSDAVAPSPIDAHVDPLALSAGVESSVHDAVEGTVCDADMSVDAVLVGERQTTRHG